MLKETQTATLYLQGLTALLARPLSAVVSPCPAISSFWRAGVVWAIIAAFMISAFGAPCCATLDLLYASDARAGAPLCAAPELAVREDRSLVIDASGTREQPQRCRHNGTCTCYRRLTTLPTSAEIPRRLLPSAPLALLVASSPAWLPPILRAFSIRAPPAAALCLTSF
jgi:hypothetical protein